MSDVVGKSVLDLLWERLDSFVDELMAPAHEGGELELAERKGHAYGMAEAIALVTNPYHPDIDAVRGEAMERWGQRSRVDSAPIDTSEKRRLRERTTSMTDDERRRRREQRAARRAARNG